MGVSEEVEVEELVLDSELEASDKEVAELDSRIELLESEDEAGVEEEVEAEEPADEDLEGVAESEVVLIESER